MSGYHIDIPTIETERLRMRAPRIEDVKKETAFFTGARSEHVGGPVSEEELWRSFAGIIGHWVIRGFGFFAVEDRETGQYHGRVGFWFPEIWPEREIGWTLMDHAEGKGIAFEAATVLRDHAYRQMGWTTAISLISDTNTRSQSLAHRLGAKREGPFTHPRFGKMGIWRHPGPDMANASAETVPYDIKETNP